MFLPNTNNYIQNLQAIKENADRQMRELQSQQNFYQQQPQGITQNFQITPNYNNSELEGKIVNSIKEVEDTFVIKTGVFLSSDFSMLYIKDLSGKIRTFKTEEVIELDEKDKQILALQDEIKKLKGEYTNDESTNEQVIESTTKTKSTKLQSNKPSNE